MVLSSFFKRVLSFLPTSWKSFREDSKYRLFWICWYSFCVIFFIAFAIFGGCLSFWASGVLGFVCGMWVCFVSGFLVCFCFWNAVIFYKDEFIVNRVEFNRLGEEHS